MKNKRFMDCIGARVGFSVIAIFVLIFSGCNIAFQNQMETNKGVDKEKEIIGERVNSEIEQLSQELYTQIYLIALNTNDYGKRHMLNSKEINELLEKKVNEYINERIKKTTDKGFISDIKNIKIEVLNDSVRFSANLYLKDVNNNVDKEKLLNIERKLTDDPVLHIGKKGVYIPNPKNENEKLIAKFIGEHLLDNYFLTKESSADIVIAVGKTNNLFNKINLISLPKWGYDNNIIKANGIEGKDAYSGVVGTLEYNGKKHIAIYGVGLTGTISAARVYFSAQKEYLEGKKISFAESKGVNDIFINKFNFFEGWNLVEQDMPMLFKDVLREEKKDTKDTDLDGISDKLEIQMGTSPNNWDTNRDGVSDKFDANEEQISLPSPSELSPPPYHYTGKGVSLIYIVPADRLKGIIYSGFEPYPFVPILDKAIFIVDVYKWEEPRSISENITHPYNEITYRAFIKYNNEIGDQPIKLYLSKQWAIDWGIQLYSYPKYSADIDYVEYNESTKISANKDGKEILKIRATKTSSLLTEFVIDSFSIPSSYFFSEIYKGNFNYDGVNNKIIKAPTSMLSSDMKIGKLNEIRIPELVQCGVLTKEEMSNPFFVVVWDKFEIKIDPPEILSPEESHIEPSKRVKYIDTKFVTALQSGRIVVAPLNSSVDVYVKVYALADVKGSLMAEIKKDITLASDLVHSRLGRNIHLSAGQETWVYMGSFTLDEETGKSYSAHHKLRQYFIKVFWKIDYPKFKYKPIFDPKDPKTRPHVTTPNLY